MFVQEMVKSNPDSSRPWGHLNLGRLPAMILIGQFDSPFVRRVAIAMRRYGIGFEHRPWSVWADSEQLARYNPLRRVPTVVLDGGECLIESAAILDALDELVGPDRALLPPSGAARRDGLRIVSLATGLADKAVSLFYEPLLRADPSAKWMDRCAHQIGDTLTALEVDRARRSTSYWLGDSLTHADIAFACAWRFTREAHGDLVEIARYPHLAEQSDRCEALEEFRAIAQPIVVQLKS
jgi:glutathione S-transferase